METTTLFADVIVPLAVPKHYTYRVPASLMDEVMPGKRALVQFGKTRIYTGIISRVHETPPADYTAKYIEAILDGQPVVTDLQLKFWEWIAFYYVAMPGEVMNAALPSGLKLSSTSHLQLHPEFDPSQTEGFTDKEITLIEALQASASLSMDDAASALNIKGVQRIVQALIKKNAVVLYEDVQEKYKPRLQSFLRLADELRAEGRLHETLDKLEKKAFKQAEALLLYLHVDKTQDHKTGWVRKADLLKQVDQSAISALVKKNILEEKQFEISRLLFEKSSRQQKALSSIQARALEEIQEIFGKGQPALLHGVTGSGKTEIYIQLIRETLEQNKQVLFLIPEIALTTQLITRLRAVFGEAVGVYHSRFSENERVEIWDNLLKDGASLDDTELPPGTEKKSYRVILGARSALFLPFTRLGLVIVDEEHDPSFKQHDPSPRYHARDTALYLAAMHKAHVLLGSATPSLESYYNADQKKYGLVELTEQHVRGGGTELEICDVNYFTTTNQMKTSLTPPLFEAMLQALQKKKQVILFQNRRGFAPYTECRQCGHVPQCINCDVSLIYHKQQERLVCHYCGYGTSPPKTCAACGSNQLHYKGMGTEKVEEDISILFPDARIARMDLDSTRSKYAYKQLIDDFEIGKIDILIGTQMVTKGLDFANVSVVGVLNADAALNFPDFRSFERAYQLLTQVRGRAGRDNEIGKVFIQTTRTTHKVIELLRQNNYRLFYDTTLAERQQYDYPPFSRLFELNVISRDKNEVSHLAGELFNLLKPAYEGHLLGPEFPLVSRIKNQFHKRIMIKIPRGMSAQTARQFITAALDTLQNHHKDWRYKVAVDVDPL